MTTNSFEYGNIFSPQDDELLADIDFDYPNFSGTEFIETHQTIDEHPYATAFGQFLGNGIDPDTANLLAHGQNRFDLISDDWDDPLRQRATRIYDRFLEMNYWPDDDESGHEPENFTWSDNP